MLFIFWTGQLQHLSIVSIHLHAPVLTGHGHSAQAPNPLVCTGIIFDWKSFQKHRKSLWKGKWESSVEASSKNPGPFGIGNHAVFDLPC